MSVLERFKKIELLKSELIELSAKLSTMHEQTKLNLVKSTKQQAIDFLKEQGFTVAQPNDLTVNATFASMGLVLTFDNQDYMGVWSVIRAVYGGPNKKIRPFEISIYRIDRPSVQVRHSEKKLDELVDLENRVKEYRDSIEGYSTPNFVFDLRDSSNNSSRSQQQPLAKDVKDISEIITILLNSTLE